MAQSVNMSQLVEDVAGRTGMTKAQAKQAVSAVLDVVGERLAAGDRVQMSGFGTFEVRERAEREGVNPRTREKTRIAASRSVGFKASSSLKSRVSGTSSTSSDE
jgi:DNA-binding protein HU-beta